MRGTGLAALNWTSQIPLTSQNSPQCNSEANSRFWLGKLCTFVSSWKFSALTLQCHRCSSKTFYLAVEDMKTDRAPVLLQYRSSRWFILTTVSVAIFTVGKHLATG